MSQPQRTPMTPAEFLDWEAKQETRWEFDGLRPVAMNGVSVAHSVIQTNLSAALANCLRGSTCRVFGPSLKVEIGPKYRYPDIFASCSREPSGACIITQPVVIFEILSDSTARTDRTIKLIEYRSLPSLQRYVMLEQDQALATVVGRTDTGWSLEILDSAGIIRMPEIGAEVPVAEIYESLDLPPLPDEDAR